MSERPWRHRQEVFLITTLTCDDNFIRPQQSFSETHSECERVDFQGALKWTKTGECNRAALTGHGEAARRHESLPLIQRSEKDEVIAVIFKASHLSLWRNPQHAGRRGKPLKCQRTTAKRKLQIHSFLFFLSPLAAIQGQSGAPSMHWGGGHRQVRYKQLWDGNGRCVQRRGSKVLNV